MQPQLTAAAGCLFICHAPHNREGFLLNPLMHLSMHWLPLVLFCLYMTCTAEQLASHLLLTMIGLLKVSRLASSISTLYGRRCKGSFNCQHFY